MTPRIVDPGALPTAQQLELVHVALGALCGQWPSRRTEPAPASRVPTRLGWAYEAGGGK